MLYSNSQQFNTGINTFAFRERFMKKQDTINEIYTQLQNVFDDYYQKVREKKAQMVTKRLPGTISGPLQMLFGGAGVAIFGGSSLGLAIVGAALGFTGNAFTALMIMLCCFLLPMTGISGFFLGRGIFIKNRV